MKKFRKYLSFVVIVATAICFAACGNDEPEPQPEPDIIYIPSNISQHITLRYDQNETFDIVKFEATGDWTAEIYPTNSNFQIVESKSFSQVDWLEISPYAGSAGNWSCKLLSAPNHSYESRYAVIVLNSIKSKVKFTVTQEGMAQGGIDTPTNPPADN